MNKQGLNSMDLQKFAQGGSKAQVSDPNSFVKNGSILGTLATNGFDTSALKTNDLLRKDEWKAIDQTIVRVATSRLNAVDDLIERNLTRELGGLGTLVDEYEKQGNMTDANIDMSGVTEGEGDATDYDISSVPVPIIHKDFHINIRKLLASRNRGDALDTTQVAVATRKVTEAIETMLFYGAGMTVDGNKIYGYTTEPNVATGQLSDWSTIGNIEDDVNDMLGDAENNNHYGPFILYVSSQEWKYLRQRHDDGSGDKALDRVLDFDQIEEVKVSGALKNGDTVLVEMAEDVVQLSVAEDIQPIEWGTKGGMLANFKVLGAMVPIVKSDKAGQSGIVYYSTS